MNKPKKLICPFGGMVQARMEELHPGYCEKTCSKWLDRDEYIKHFLEAHDQRNECAHRFGLCAYPGQMAG